MITAQALLNEARKYLGIIKGSQAHHKLIDDYNRINPKPMGYAVTYQDDWCDVFVTVMFDKVGASTLIGRECGVQRHIDIFKKLGIWKAKDFPKVGDIVCFDWDKNGWADHIGIVESVENQRITTIEGNSNNKVQRNHFSWNDHRIQGYARPKYALVSEVIKSIEDVAREVIAGKWDSGDLRVHRLLESGYDAEAVQKQVNLILSPAVNDTVDESAFPTLTYNMATLPPKYLEKILKLANDYQILPSLLIVMLHFEGLWGNSTVAKENNNWAGMTWSNSYIGHSSIIKTRGSLRPFAEGGHYIKYQSVEDFLKDWVYLLRPHGSYKVSGKWKFSEAVKGLFKEGGSKYDYAAIGYVTYLDRMIARKASIDLQNPGMLNQLDQNWIDSQEEVSLVTDNKVQVATDASRWQTGERIASWVKGLSFDVLETKEIVQEAYLLGNNDIPIGWILASDLN